MKFFHSDVMLLAVDCFRRNRPNDVEVTLLGAGAAFESKWIRLADLKGNLFSYPETDEQYPTLWSQQRAVLLQLMTSPDPQIQSVLGHPENFALIKRLIGLEDFVIPDEESRTKQYREIAQLVAESPIIVSSDAPNASSSTLSSRARSTAGPSQSADEGPAGPGAPSFAPVAKGGSSPGDSVPAVDVILPSIMPDEFADNHAVELEICMRWFSSDAGQVAKIESPAGYANVRAHALFHRDYLLKQQRQTAQTAVSSQEGGAVRP